MLVFDIDVARTSASLTGHAAGLRATLPGEGAAARPGSGDT